MTRRNVAMLLLLAGCGLSTERETDELRRAVPTADDLQVRVPEGGGGGEAGVLRAALGERAGLYQMTRAVSRGVNGAIAGILILVRFVVDHPPSHREDDRAVWGPYTESLSPLTYLLVVERRAPSRYAYVVSAKPRDAGDEGYVPILAGESTVGAEGIRGSLGLDLDAAHALDADEHPDVGRIGAEYDTTGDPRWLRVGFEDVSFDGTPTDDAAYEYSEGTDRSGTFEFAVVTDLDPSHATAEELLVIGSRWQGDGAGRGDAVATGGDIPSGFVAQMTECWDRGFSRTYYSDNFGGAAEGEADACPFAEALEVDFGDPAETDDGDGEGDGDGGGDDDGEEDPGDPTAR